MKEARRTADRICPRHLAYIALFAALIAICSWIVIPIPSGVPITLQTFGVFMTLLALGGKRGTYSVVVWLLMGCVGLPVFSGLQSGFGVMVGPAGGYAFGFLVAALIFWAMSARKSGTLFQRILWCVLAQIGCYLSGVTWFALVYAHELGVAGAADLLVVCVLPYIISDSCKIVLAVSLSARVRKALTK